MKKIFFIGLLLIVMFYLLNAERLATEGMKTELRKSPDGEKVGEINSKALFHVIQREGEWVKVVVEGWILKNPKPSAQVRKTEVESAVSTTQLTFDILETNPLENSRTEVKVKVKNTSIDTVKSAKLTCKALNEYEVEIASRSYFVVRADKEVLEPDQSLEYIFILDADYYQVSSFSLKWESVEFQ